MNILEAFFPHTVRPDTIDDLWLAKEHSRPGVRTLVSGMGRLCVPACVQKADNYREQVV